MKHRTLRCAAETLVLLLIAVMAVFLAAGLHQRAPDGALSTLSTGWYQLTDGVRREVTLPAALETGPGQTITLYNDTLTDSDGGKVLSARGVEYGIEIRAGETLLYRYEDNAFPKNAQMKGRLWADTELPYGLGGQTLSLTFTELPGRMCRIDAPVLGSMPAVTGRHIQSSLFSAGMILVMLVLAVLALLIFLYMSFYGIRERRFLDTAVFLLLCSLWCLTDSGLYQLYGTDTAAGSVVSFYAFMTMAIPMVHFVRNTVSGRLRLVPDVLIALLCANALAQGAAYRLFGVPFIDMLPLTHLLLTAGVAAMLTVLFRSYRAQPAPQLRLRIAAFAALGAFGVAALVQAADGAREACRADDAVKLPEYRHCELSPVECEPDGRHTQQRAQRGGERRETEQQQVPFRHHEIGKRHQRQRDRRQGVHRREQVAELRQDEGDDDDDDGDREDGEDHRVHERGFDLLIHLMRLFIVDGEPLRDPVEPAAALARADHAEHERREHLLRLERVGQARALAHLAQHALVHAAQTGADALVLGNDRERAHQTDARGEQRGKLAAQVA